MAWQKHACFLTQCCFRANDHGHPCPFHTEIFPDTLNLSITSCTADDEIFNVFAFSHYSEIVPQFVDTLFCRLVNLLWEIQSKMLLLEAKCSSSCYFIALLPFPLTCFVHPNFFEMYLWDFTVNIMWLYEICNPSVLIHFMWHPDFSGIGFAEVHFFNIVVLSRANTKDHLMFFLWRIKL